jgi:hypothetical protein
MMHVIARCSTVERWDRSGRTFGRQWPDLVAGRPRASYVTVKALISRGLLYRDDEGIGLTPDGVRAWIELPTSVKTAAI